MLLLCALAHAPLCVLYCETHCPAVGKLPLLNSTAFTQLLPALGMLEPPGHKWSIRTLVGSPDTSLRDQASICSGSCYCSMLCATFYSQWFVFGFFCSQEIPGANTTPTLQICSEARFNFPCMSFVMPNTFVVPQKPCICLSGCSYSEVHYSRYRRTCLHLHVRCLKDTVLHGPAPKLILLY